LKQKPIKNFGKSSRGHSQGLPKNFRAHRVVIFAVGQLSCFAEFLMQYVTGFLASY